MKIKGITVLKSIFPLVIKEQPSQRTLEAIAKFTSNPQFIQLRKILRMAYRIPNRGLPLSKLKVKNTFSNVPDQSELVSYTLLIGANIMRGKVDLADDFLPQLILMFFFNAFIDLDEFKGFVSRPIRFISGKANIAASMFNYPYEIGAILIPFTVSKHKFKEWVNENWDRMQKEMDNLPNDPMGNRIHKNWQFALDIIDMRDRLKKSFPEISTELSKDYPDDEHVSDESWVKKVYFDYKKILDAFMQSPELRS